VKPHEVITYVLLRVSVYCRWDEQTSQFDDDPPAVNPSKLIETRVVVVSFEPARIELLILKRIGSRRVNIKLKRASEGVPPPPSHHSDAKI